MRYVIMLFVLLASGLSSHSHGAAAAPGALQAVVTRYSLAPDEVQELRQQCSGDGIPVFRADARRGPVAIKLNPINHDGNLLTLPAAPADLAGGGYRVEVSNQGSTPIEGVAILNCMSAGALGITLNAFQRTLAPGQTTFFAISCNAPQVPVGVATDADGIDVEERARVFLVGSNGMPLNAIEDGTYTGAPTAWGMGYRNSTAGPRPLNGQTICADLPNAQTTVLSGPVFPAIPYEVFSPLPDGSERAGFSFAVSGSIETDIAIAGSGPASYEFEEFAVDGESAFVEALTGIALYGTGAPSSLAKQAAVGRAIIGSILVPSATPVPPPTIVAIVEFYNAALDHYFITANPREIADLDSGVHVGWQRTSESFNAYGIGSSGRTGRRPVCRAYGNPAAGLDSHFYSGSPRECVATIRNFGGAWLLEASKVFEIELPDTTTGACAADRVSVYRLWNNRVDSSHRFVKTLALRTQMIARGFVSEGYGPNGVVFCALP